MKDHPLEDQQLEQLFDVLEDEFRDPVEALENRLAARRGVYRGPGISNEQWRKLRILIIDGFKGSG